jgi:hypothetical protein
MHLDAVRLDITQLNQLQVPLVLLAQRRILLDNPRKVYDFDFPASNITIAFISAPSAPICADTVLILKQRASSTMYGITAWPSGIKWPGGVAQTMPQTLSARMRVVISTSPSGIIDVSATWMGV